MDGGLLPQSHSSAERTGNKRPNTLSSMVKLAHSALTLLLLLLLLLLLQLSD